MKRKVKTFNCKIGFNGDDFVMNRKTVAITYTLDRQKHRRIWWIALPIPNFKRLTTRTLSELIWREFKTKFNVVNT